MTAVEQKWIIPTWEEMAAVTAAATPALGDGPIFHSVLCVEGVETSDHRLLAVDGAHWRTPPIPLMVMLESSHGGEAGGAVVAGRFETITVVGRRIIGTGVIDLAAPGGPTAAKMVENRTLRFVSIDIGDADEILMVDQDGEIVRTFDNYEIMGATIVPFSAFAGEAVIWLDGMDAPTEALAELPVPPALTEMPDEEGGLLDVLLASDSPGLVVTAAGTWKDERPPAEFFTEPPVCEGMINVSEDGRVWGRFYTKGQCHRGALDRCLMVGPSKTGYAMFSGQGAGILCDDGERVYPGPLVFARDHAPTSDGWDAKRAAQFYSDVGTQVAAIVCGDHYENGRYCYSWYSGAIHPDVTSTDIRILGTSAVSGDWRPVNGNLELCGLMAVNTPGYPQMRARVASGQPVAVIASAAPAPVPCADCGQTLAEDPGPHAFKPSEDGGGGPCAICGKPEDAPVHSQAAAILSLRAEVRALGRLIKQAFGAQIIAAIEKDIHL